MSSLRATSPYAARVTYVYYLSLDFSGGPAQGWHLAEQFERILGVEVST